VPFTITATGIYCLKKSLANATNPAPANLAGAIEIEADNVTLDLNDFSLTNNSAGSANRMNGVVAFNRKNVIVRNGQVDGFATAVLLGGILAQRSLVENIRANASNERGLFVVGDNSVIRNNHITNVGPGDVDSEATGITLVFGENSVVEGNVISSVSETASAHGIAVVFSASTTVRANTVFNVKDASQKHGISLFSVTRAEISGNHLLNGAAGNAGIANMGFSTQIGCIGNAISGFVPATSGCGVSVGDVAF
jgi:Periplasmic copper-binding protein (NosD)